MLLTHSKILSSEDRSPQGPKKQTVNLISCHSLDPEGSGLVGMRNKVTSLMRKINPRINFIEMN